MATRDRADQVGSVLRPPELLEARAAHAEGRLILEERRAEDFLPARIEAGGDATVVVLGDGTRWALPAPMSGGPAPGRLVTLGIRPDDLRFVGDGTGEREGEVTAAVSVVEPLGNETLLSVTLAGQEVTAKAEGLVIPAIGDRVRLVPRLANLHLFDPATGAALR